MATHIFPLARVFSILDSPQVFTIYCKVRPIKLYKTPFFLIALFMASQSIALEGDLERLSCFDEHFAAIVKEEPLTAAASNWTVATETSPINDTKNVFVRLDSDENIRGRYGSPGPMIINIMCRENTTDLSIYFNDLHMSDHQYGTITYRLDKQKARKKALVESTSNKHLGLWGGGKSIPFLKSMLTHDKLFNRSYSLQRGQCFGDVQHSRYEGSN